MRDTLLASALLLVGIASGYGIKRAITAPPAHAPAPPAKTSHTTAPPAKSRPTPDWPIRTDRPSAEIAALPSGAMQTAETVMWLPRATAAELRDFWRQLAANKSNDYRLKNLLMNRWMELAPDEAIAETVGTEDAHLPWMAWGRLDPELAAREAKARKSGQFWRVLQGAAAVHPEAVQKLLEENPGYAYPAVTGAIREGLQNDSWQAALDYEFDNSTLVSWSRYEPERAFDWAMDNATKVKEYDSPWNELVAQMLETAPEKFEATLAGLPEGKLKNDLTLEKARVLATSDPSAVLAMAEAAEAGAPRNRLLAIAGPALLASDPERSLQLFREVVSSGITETTMLRPNGDRTTTPLWLSDSYKEWVAPLLKQDPNAVMDGLPAATVASLAERWMLGDFDGFGQWAADLPEGEMRDFHCSRIAQTLSSSEIGDNYPKAMEWAARISAEKARSSANETVIHYWLRADRPGAEAYFGPQGTADAGAKAIFEDISRRTPLR